MPEPREKGLGYFGKLKRPDGYISTELSIGVNIDGKEMEIPSLVPTLTKEERDYLLAGNKPSEKIVQKAVAHARARTAKGRSPFAQPNETKQEGLMPEPRAFTNIPGQPGEYAPARPGWEGPAQVRPEAREEATTFPRPPAIGEGFMTPDYSNRSLFEKHVFGEIGGDPFKLNPREALQFADENLPDLFEQFFQGTVVWEDKEKLTKDQAGQWDEVVKGYHAWTLKEAEMKKAVMTDRYNFMMNQFDNASREYQTALTKVRGRREAALALKRTQEKAAAKPEAVSPIDLKRYSDMLRNIEKDMAKGSIQQAQVDTLNMVAREIGAPEMIIEETELDPHWLERAYDFVKRQETIKEKVELKKKPESPKVPPKPGKKPTAKKKVKPGRTLDPKNKADRALAKRLLKKAGGDVQKARQLAREMGYAF